MKKQGKIIQKFVMFVKCIIVKFFMSSFENCCKMNFEILKSCNYNWLKLLRFTKKIKLRCLKNKC